MEVQKGQFLHVVKWKWAGGPTGKWLPKHWCEWWVGKGLVKFLLRGRAGHGISCVRREPWGPEGLKRRPSVLAWKWLKMAIKKKSADVGKGAHSAPVETEYLKDLMPLVEHCCMRQYDDGSPREPGWVTLKVQGSAWVVQVKDPDTCCSFNAVAEKLDNALMTAALMLASEDAPWEPDTFLKAMKARKK